VTYWEFLALVMLPAVVLAAFFALRPSSRLMAASWRAGIITVGLLAPVAVLYTTPWDHYLIVHGIWRYLPHRVLATFYAIPVEEYTFMALQTLTTGMWTLYLVCRNYPSPTTSPLNVHAERRLRLLAVLGWLSVIVAAMVFEGPPSLTYGRAIVVWFGPPLLLQSAVGAETLRARRLLRLIAIGIPTLLLWCADRFAIGQETWIINPRLTVSFRPFGLPIEEAVFFFLTNLLIVDSLILGTDPRVRARLNLRGQLGRAAIRDVSARNGRPSGALQ
jgi:lycopene beta-cyclase